MGTSAYLSHLLQGLLAQFEGVIAGFNAGHLIATRILAF